MTLVEVMVVVTLSILILGLATSLFVAVQRRDFRIRGFAVEWERHAALVEQLRIDLRGATRASLADKGVLLVEQPGSRQIRYELSASGCRRSAQEPGQTTPRVEMFAVSRADAWTLEPGPPGRRQMFVVSLRRGERSEAPVGTKAPLLVYAALGADLPVKSVAENEE